VEIGGTNLRQLPQGVCDRRHNAWRFFWLRPDRCRARRKGGLQPADEACYSFFSAMALMGCLPVLASWVANSTVTVSPSCSSLSFTPTVLVGEAA
jgi:hypothetical protein